MRPPLASRAAGRRSQVAGRRSHEESTEVKGGAAGGGQRNDASHRAGGGRNTMERAPPNPDRHALSRAHVGRRLQGTGRWVRAQARARGFGHGSVSHHSVGLSPWSHAGDARARRRGGRRGGGGAERHERCLPSPPCRQVLSISIVSIPEQAMYEQCTQGVMMRWNGGVQKCYFVKCSQTVSKSVSSRSPRAHHTTVSKDASVFPSVH